MKMMIQQQNLETTSVTSPNNSRPPPSQSQLTLGTGGVLGAKGTTGNLLGLNTSPLGITDNPNYSSTQNRATTTSTSVPHPHVVDIIAADNTG